MSSSRIARALRIFGLAVLLSLASCHLVSYEDVSDQAPYDQLIGRRFASTVATELCGITMDREYASRVDELHIFPPPGIAGPEVISRRNLPAGTIIEIRKVMRCTDCLFFEAQVRFVVDVESLGEVPEAPVSISREYVLSGEAAFRPL